MAHFKQVGVFYGRKQAQMEGVGTLAQVLAESAEVRAAVRKIAR